MLNSENSDHTPKNNNLKNEKERIFIEKNENQLEKNFEKKILLKSKKEEKNKNKRSKSNKEPLINKETLIPPECNIIPYIPKKISKKQKTLVLDLDETLVHSYFDKAPPYEPDISFDIEISGMPIHITTLIRPGAYQFLEEMSKLYEIVIFTASLSQYAIPLLNIIDKKNLCEHKLFREHCYIYDNKGNPGYIKDLTKLNRDMNSLIILDNNPNCYYLNKDNGIPIKTWFSDKNDKELFKIKPYLEFLANDFIVDVKPILNKVKEGKKIKYHIFDELIENYFKKMNSKIKEEKIYNTINNDNNHNNSKTIESSKIKNPEDKTNEKDTSNFTINKSAEKTNKKKEELLNINIKNLKTEKIEEKNKIDVNSLTLENDENVKEKENNFNENNKNNENKKDKYFESGENKINSLENETKDSILNSREKSTNRIFLQIKNEKKLNNIKCINLFQKNIKTIENENIINRYKNYNINNINNKLKTYYKNRNFYENEKNSKEKEKRHKLNIVIKNENKKKLSHDSPKKNSFPIKILNEKKGFNLFKLKLNDYKLNINKFKLKLNSNKIKTNKENNISFNRIIKKAKMRLKNTSEINNNIINNNIKRKIRVNENKHSHYNIGICLSEFNLDDNNNSSFKINSTKKSINLNINNFNSQENFNKIKEGFKSYIFNNKANNVKDMLILKSKTMYNLSNKENINKKRLCLEQIDNEYLKKMKKNNSIYTNKKCDIKNYHKNKTISINQMINKTERDKKIIGKKISQFDNIIYSKKTNQKEKENKSSTKNNTNPNKLNLKTLDINIKKILQLKLPLSKRVNLYSGLQKEFYNKNKIISFVNKNKLKNNNNNFQKKKESNNIMENAQLKEDVKRLNFFSQKKRRGLSLANVNKALAIRIKSCHSAIE